MAGLKPITRDEAMKEPAAHAFAPGRGYYRPSSPLEYGRSKGACRPLAVAAEGSRHKLQPPQGGVPMTAIWMLRQQCWAMPGGRRLAFPADYLASHGWRYAGPVT